MGRQPILINASALRVRDYRGLSVSHPIDEIARQPGLQIRAFRLAQIFVASL